MSGPRGLSSSALDSTAELLSALNPAERELLEAITARGYSLHTAITALQRTGQQTPDEVSVISNNKAVLLENTWSTFGSSCRDHAVCSLNTDAVQIQLL